MDLDDTPEQAAYRAQVRTWLAEHKSQAPVLTGPDALKDEDEIVAARRAWQGKLAEGGLAGVTWPKEYGGQGLGPIEQLICNQEIAQAKVPGILDAIGVGMLGPTLIAHGAEEQKARYLGPMLHGDEVWCQLFSEPAAGSDLAAVQARARLQDDGSWRLTGQKVWTTNAQFASYGLLLARTDADVPKHKGMTMFIVPMDGAGVTVRGLRQISGEAEFNEVFFDDVALDADAVVGGVGNGWGTALTTLMFERVTIGLGGEGLGYNSTRFAKAIADDEHARRDPEVRHQLGEIVSELLAVRFTGYRTLTALQKGQIPGPEAGLAKVTIVNGAIKAGDLITDVVGPDALAEDSEWAYMISFLPGLKSAGGTEEILRNTIGERVLGLPPEPRLDKGIPFSELRSKERRQRRGHANPRTLRRAGVPARGRARRALALQDDRSRPRGARRQRAAARPVADRDRGGLARSADRRVRRRRGPGRLRRDARARRVRPRAGRRGAARPPARDRDPERLAKRGEVPARGRQRRAAGRLSARPTARRPRRSVEHGPGQRPGAWDSAHRRSARSRIGRVPINGSFAFVPDAPGASGMVGVALQDGRPIGIAVLSDSPGVEVAAGEPLRRDQVAGPRLVHRRARRSSWTPPRSPSPAPGTSPRR